jgi:hypothetical protein
MLLSGWLSGSLLFLIPISKKGRSSIQATNFNGRYKKNLCNPLFSNVSGQITFRVAKYAEEYNLSVLLEDL